jgi:hypothetical protein
MVLDKIWKKAVPNYIEIKKELKEKYPTESKSDIINNSFTLCFPCLEIRLKRKLTIKDFNLSLPINYGIKLGFEMGSRAL